MFIQQNIYISHINYKYKYNKVSFMNQNKSKKITLIFTIVILLILSSFVSLGTSTEVVDDTSQKTNEMLRVKTIKSTFSAVNTDGSVTQPSSGPSPSSSGNIIVTDDSGNESYPSMVVSGFNTLIAYEYENKGIYLRNTNQYGENWSAPVKLSTTRPVYSPSLCIRPNKKQAYGVFTSSDENFGITGVFEISDITDPLGEIIPKAWEWSDHGFYNFSNPDIVYHDKTEVPWITCSIGSTTFEDGPCNESLMFTYLDEDNSNSAWISWDPAFEYCSNVSLTTSDDSKKIYGVCEIKNGTNQDLLFFSGIYKSGVGDPEIELTIYNKTFAGLESLTHPQIFVYNNKIYIVAVSDIDGIVLFTSPTGFINFNKEIIDIIPMSSKYPLIYVDDTRIFCTYVYNGNIFLTNSSDGGVAWETPLLINSQDNSVVEDYCFADFPNKNLIVWTDNREEDHDLYLCKLGQPEMNLLVVPESVEIESEGYTFIATKNRIKFTIMNLGEAPVEKVKVGITYFSKGLLRETEHQGTIAYLEGGAEETLNRPLFRFTAREFFSALYNFAGIEYINVTVDPEGKYDEVDTSDNTVTILVDYENIFPVLKGLEQIFI